MKIELNDYYKVLEVSPDASQEEINKAFKQKVRQFHTDINHTAEAEERMREINDAGAILRDPGKRSRYDDWIRDAEERARAPPPPPPPWSPPPPSSPPPEPEPEPEERFSLSKVVRRTFAGVLAAAISVGVGFYVVHKFDPKEELSPPPIEQRADSRAVADSKAAAERDLAKKHFANVQSYTVDESFATMKHSGRESERTPTVQGTVDYKLTVKNQQQTRSQEQQKNRLERLERIAAGLAEEAKKSGSKYLLYERVPTLLINTVTGVAENAKYDKSFWFTSRRDDATLEVYVPNHTLYEELAGDGRIILEIRSHAKKDVLLVELVNGYGRLNLDALESGDFDEQVTVTIGSLQYAGENLKRGGAVLGVERYATVTQGKESLHQNHGAYQAERSEKKGVKPSNQKASIDELLPDADSGVKANDLESMLDTLRSVTSARGVKSGPSYTPAQKRNPRSHYAAFTSAEAVSSEEARVVDAYTTECGSLKKVARERFGRSGSWLSKQGRALTGYASRKEAKTARKSSPAAAQVYV